MPGPGPFQPLLDVFLRAIGTGGGGDPVVCLDHPEDFSTTSTVDVLVREWAIHTTPASRISGAQMGVYLGGILRLVGGGGGDSAIATVRLGGTLGVPDGAAIASAGTSSLSDQVIRAVDNATKPGADDSLLVKLCLNASAGTAFLRGAHIQLFTPVVF